MATQSEDAGTLDMDLCDVKTEAEEEDEDPNEVMMTEQEAIEFAKSHPRKRAYGSCTIRQRQTHFL